MTSLAFILGLLPLVFACRVPGSGQPAGHRDGQFSSACWSPLPSAFVFVPFFFEYGFTGSKQN